MRLANAVNSEAGEAPEISEVSKSKNFKAVDILIQNGKLGLIVMNPGDLEEYLV